MSAKIRVLVIDDEAAILRFLKPALEANNYEMTSAGTIAEGIKRIAAETPDIVLLDLGLPDGDGKDVIRRAREWSDLPIIVLSARERETEKIESLDLGADDYVNKPFNVGELLARMRAALRHRMQRKSEIPVLRVGNLEVDAVRHRASRAGAELKLTPKEFELLSFLARHAGRVVTHKQILTAVWGPAHTEDTQYLRVYIGQLRQKIEDHPDDPRFILTEPGIGYRIAENWQITPAGAHRSTQNRQYVCSSPIEPQVVLRDIFVGLSNGLSPTSASTLILMKSGGCSRLVRTTFAAGRAVRLHRL